MRTATQVACRIVLACSMVRAACGQATAAGDPGLPLPRGQDQIQQQMQQLAVDLGAAQARLQDSEREIERLKNQLAAMQAQLAPGQQPPPETRSEISALADDTKEKVDILQAEVKQHEQTKVESASKYPVHLTGLVLFNFFVNKGGVDNLDLPSLATRSAPGASDLAAGAGIRQTILGVQATGPRVFGAHSSADVNIDFYGDIPYSNYGTTGGGLRMRTAALRLDWERDSAEVGLVEPLISPLSPTSYATVAEPSLAWAGNLWTWSPQLSYEHRFGRANAPHLGWQAALWDPPAAGYNTDALFRTPSSGERTGQPAYETRLYFASDETITNGQGGGLQVGVSGYYDRQSYPGRSGDSWATTADWRVPIGKVVQVSGEAYRGRAIGGLGGGVYKDVVSGTDPRTGLPTFRLLNAAGGWSQLKLRLARTIEANGAFGLDDGFARDFHSLVLPANAGSTQTRTRNQMATVNLIFSPKTYLILSPEFRRIRTWPIAGESATSSVFTMSFGFRF